MTRCVRPRAGAAWPAALPLIPYMRRNLSSKRTTLADADAVIAVSSAIARDLVARAPELRHTRIEQIPNAVDVEGIRRAADDAAADRRSRTCCSAASSSQQGRGPSRPRRASCRAPGCRSWSSATGSSEAGSIERGGSDRPRCPRHGLAAARGRSSLGRSRVGAGLSVPRSRVAEPRAPRSGGAWRPDCGHGHRRHLRHRPPPRHGPPVEDCRRARDAPGHAHRRYRRWPRGSGSAARHMWNARSTRSRSIDRTARLLYRI